MKDIPSYHLWPSPTRISVRQDVLWVGAVALVYLAVAQLSLSLVFQPQGIAAAWPPSGLFLAALLLTRRDLRPALAGTLFLADWAVEMLAGTPPTVSVLYALVLTGEAVLSAWLLLRVLGDPVLFRGVRAVAVWLGLSVLLSSGLSGLAAATASTLLSEPGRFWDSWRWWATSDGVGNLLMTPFLLSWGAWFRGWGKTRSHERATEQTALLLALALLNVALFHRFSQHPLFALLLPYTTVPFLMWAALRFDVCGVTSVLVLVAAWVVPLAAAGRVVGLSDAGAPDAVLDVQLFLATMAVPALFLATAVGERRQAHDALREKEERLRLFIEHAPAALAMFDRAMRYIEVSHRWLVDYGLGEQDLRGLSHYEVFPEIPERWKELHRRGLAGEVLRAEADRFDRADGSTQWLHWEIRPWFVAAGEVGGIVIFSEDITGRKQAEEALRKGKEQLRFVTDHAPVLLAHCDRDLHYRFVNQPYADMFGRRAAELVGKHPRDMLGEKAFAEALPHMEAALAGQPDEYDLALQAVSGGPRIVRVRYEPERAAGRVVGFVAAIVDITLRKRAEDAVLRLHETLQRQVHELDQRVAERTVQLAEAAERAESADRLKSAFLATMSHELRTPLNSIIGFTGLLLQCLPGPLNEEQTKQLTMIRGSSRHLLSLINDILDLSKIEAEQLTVAAEPFDLGDAIAEAASSVQPLAHERSLTLSVKISEGVGEVVSDSRRVQQVLLNLLTNAVKFTEAGGATVTVESIPDYIAPGDESARAAVAIRVTDTGIGIRPEDLEELFQPFHQVDNGLARRHEGTGLGLAVSRRLAKLLGGEVRAESHWGQGSAFTFILPVQRKEPS